MSGSVSEWRPSHTSSATVSFVSRSSSCAEMRSARSSAGSARPSGLPSRPWSRARSGDPPCRRSPPPPSSSSRPRSCSSRVRSASYSTPRTSTSSTAHASARSTPALASTRRVASPRAVTTFRIAASTACFGRRSAVVDRRGRSARDDAVAEPRGSRWSARRCRSRDRAPRRMVVSLGTTNRSSGSVAVECVVDAGALGPGEATRVRTDRRDRQRARGALRWLGARAVRGTAREALPGAGIRARAPAGDRLLVAGRVTLDEARRPRIAARSLCAADEGAVALHVGAAVGHRTTRAVLATGKPHRDQEQQSAHAHRFSNRRAPATYRHRIGGNRVRRTIATVMSRLRLARPALSEPPREPRARGVPRH